jgi:hypothetical protein
MKCVVTITVTCCCASAVIRRQNSRRASGSAPLVGSSRKSDLAAHAAAPPPSPAAACIRPAVLPLGTRAIGGQFELSHRPIDARRAFDRAAQAVGAGEKIQIFHHASTARRARISAPRIPGAAAPTPARGADQPRPLQMCRRWLEAGRRACGTSWFCRRRWGRADRRFPHASPRS